MLIITVVAFFLTFFLGVLSKDCTDVFTAPRGIISSPNFPSNYPANKQCIYDIFVPQNNIIQLKFITFHLEANDKCIKDNVTIYSDFDGANFYYNHGIYCGSGVLQDIYSKGNVLRIIFSSDSTIQSSGFSVEYRTDKCGGELTALSGIINTPFYPDNYPANVKCIWDIIVPPQDHIKIQFTIFQLTGNKSKNCTDDKVIIQSLKGSNAIKQHGIYCGEDIPERITSEGNALRIEFSSGMSTRRGFSLTYYTDTCGGTLNAPMGAIFSPFFPDLYPNNKTCKWEIVAPFQDHIYLEFLQFSMCYGVNKNEECSGDKVTVYSKSMNHESKIHGVYCGNNKPQSIISTENTLNLEFFSDSENTCSGFSAIYYTDSCGGVLTAPFGEITSPLFPKDYPSNKKCIWEIHAPINHRIKLNFKHFNIEKITQGCINDYLMINSIINDTSTKLHGMYCGSTIPWGIISESNILHLEFTSDKSGQFSGFSASYEIEFRPTVCIKEKCHNCSVTAKGNIKRVKCENMASSKEKTHFDFECTDSTTDSIMRGAQNKIVQYDKCLMTNALTKLCNDHVKSNIKIGHNLQNCNVCYESQCNRSTTLNCNNTIFIIYLLYVILNISLEHFTNGCGF